MCSKGMFLRRILRLFFGPGTSRGTTVRMQFGRPRVPRETGRAVPEKVVGLARAWSQRPGIQALRRPPSNGRPRSDPVLPTDRRAVTGAVARDETERSRSPPGSGHKRAAFAGPSRPAFGPAARRTAMTNRRDAGRPACFPAGYPALSLPTEPQTDQDLSASPVCTLRQLAHRADAPRTPVTMAQPFQAFGAGTIDLRTQLC